MKLATIIVSRSKSCSVKTLHVVLKINIKCLQNNINNEITYVNDDPYDKAEIIQKYMKSHERIIFIDHGIGIDDESIQQLLEPHENIGCLVMPGPLEGIDWDMFKSKVKNDSSEPVHQMGLTFDTVLGKKISDNIYHVLQTKSKCWMMNTKNVIKTIKDRKTGTWKISPKIFDKFKEQGVKIYAFTASKLTITYTHECISNILNAAGVKVS